MRLPTVFTAFLLFVLPLVVFPLTPSFFETPKIILAEILIELLIFFSLVQSSKYLKKINSTFLLLIICIAALTLLHLFIFGPKETFFGNIFRLQGIFMLCHLLAFSFLSSCLAVSDKMKRWASAISLIMLLISIFVFGGNLSGRAVGSLGEPNALASSAIFLLTFSFFLHKNPLIKVLGVVETIAVIILSGSRSSLITFSILGLFLLLQLKLSLKKAFLICLVFALLSLSLPILEGGGWFENRSEIWKTAFIAGFKSPLYGWGFGRIDKALQPTSRLLNNNVQYQFVDSAHNLFLDWWLQGGIIGLGLLVSIILICLSNLLKAGKKMELSLFLAAIIPLLFNPLSIISLIYFWYSIGQGFPTSPKTRSLKLGTKTDIISLWRIPGG